MNWDLFQLCEIDSTFKNWSMESSYQQTQDEQWYNCIIRHKKRYDKTEHPFMIKGLRKLALEGNFLSLINCLKKQQLTSHLMVRNWTFSLCAHRQNKHVLSSLLVNILLEFQTTAIRQDRKRKNIQIGKQGIKLFLPTDDMTLHV